MSFSTNVPNASQSPGLFPAQNQTNLTRLKTIISQDHVFNNTANASTDGIHKKVSLQTRASTPSTPAGAASVLFTKADGGGTPQLHFYNGTDYTLTPIVAPAVTILACVNFNGTGALGANQTIRSSYGVSTVVRVVGAIARYQINFSPALANVNYIVSITGMRDSSSANRSIVGCVQSSNTYSDSVSTSRIIIRFYDEDAVDVVPLMGNVVIYGVS